MKLEVKRRWFSEKSTIGLLSIEGTAECFTLEDRVREDGRPVNAWKIPGQTAIPTGTYNVVITYSPHFGRHLPLLENVQGYEGVRIHPGNTAKDTEGCILVGVSKGPDIVYESRKAFDDLYPRIEAALNNNETVTLEIS